MTAVVHLERSQDSTSGGIWDYVSPSRLNLWLRCPLAFKLRYVDGERTPTSTAAFIGKSVHAALEVFYRHRQCGIVLEPIDVVRRLANRWEGLAADESVQFKSSADSETCRNQAATLVQAYLTQIPADEPVPVAVETSLEAPLIDPATGEDFGIPLLGVLDLVLEAATGPVIADFKTASRGGELLEVTHEIQLSSYAYLFRQLSGQQESALQIRSLIKTKDPRIEVHEFAARSELHFRRLFGVIRAYLDDLHSGQYLYRPSLACGMCEFRHRQCRSWSG